MRILLTGYYGRANFGDDVLMQVTHRIVRLLFPEANISVLVDGQYGDYVSRFIPDATILTPAYHGKFDAIIHGGGGVFFDYAHHGALATLIGSMIEKIGFSHYLYAEHMLRTLLNKPRTTAVRRVGLGIGVGTFSAGSTRLLHKLPLIADMDALWVRDSASVENLARFRSVMKGDIIEGSDLAFLHEYWQAPHEERRPSARPKLGIALRDWGAQNPKLPEILSQLSEQFELTGFVLDHESDRQTIKLLEPYTTHVWNPRDMSIADFTEPLAQQHVLLTSRAHGAICAACLGIPSVIVPIEPKLQQVHTMLSQSSTLATLDDPCELTNAVQKLLDISIETIADDVAKNRARSQSALSRAMKVIQ